MAPVQPPMLAVGSINPIPPLSPLGPIASSHPDSTRDMLLQFGFAQNPLTQYRQERNFFTRRRMCYEFALRNPAFMSLVDSVGDEIAAQEIYIVPTETNPSASTILQAQNSVQVMNHAMSKKDGILDFIKIFIESVWASKTGAFIMTQHDDHGRVNGVNILNPMLAYPYYGWQAAYGTGGMLKVPVINPQYDTSGNYITQAQGIWFVDTGFISGVWPAGGVASGNYFTLPFGEYHQICPGATAFGAFLDTIPKAEHLMTYLLVHTAIVENLLDTMLATDQSQAILWQNVDPEVLKAYSVKIKSIRAKKLNNEPVDLQDEGLRLHVTAREPDKPAHAEVVNFRAFPTGFDPLSIMNELQANIALGLGLNPRRASPAAISERFGNAQQAAMLNSDEPGTRAVEHSIINFVTGVILDELPLRADFIAANSPKNYAIVAKDQVVAQSLSQLKDLITPEQAQAYLVRQGFLMPAEAGIPSIRTGDASSKSEWPQSQKKEGWLKLRWPDGRPLVYEPGIYLDSKVGLKARPTPKQPDGAQAIFNTEECALNARMRYEQWMSYELPHLVTTNGFNRHALEEDVDDLAIELYGTMVNCLKSHVSNIRTPKARQQLETLKTAWYDALGSPRLRQGNLTKPQHNLFDDLWAMQGMLMLGRATPADVARTASTYENYINRYFNALRSVFYATQVEQPSDDNPDGGPLATGPVKWVRNAEESCRDCLAFEGTYDNINTLLKASGGLLPGDPRLTCSGNCKCNLEGVTSLEATSIPL